MFKKLLTVLSVAAAAASGLGAAEKPIKALAKEIQSPKNIEDRALLMSAVQLAAVIGASAENPLDANAYKPIKALAKSYKGGRKADKPYCEAPLKSIHPISLIPDRQGSLIILSNDTALFCEQDLSEEFLPGNLIGVSLPSFVADKEAKSNSPVVVHVKNKSGERKKTWMVRAGIAAKTPAKIISIMSTEQGAHTTYTFALDNRTNWIAELKTQEIKFCAHTLHPFEGIKEWSTGDSLQIIDTGNKGSSLLVNLDRGSVLLNEAKPQR